MKRTNLIASAVLAISAAGTAQAASVSPVFVDQGLNITTAQATRMYRADLTGLGLTEVAAVKITDSNSGFGGSPGAYSGFDLDAVFLDIDGDANTLGDQIYFSSYQFMAGTLRPGGMTSPTAGPTSGSSSSTTVDEGFATLNDVDGVFFGTGSLTLGDGGMLSAILASKIAVGPSLYLFVGEVSGDAGELVAGSIEVTDVPPPPAVPLPASSLLLLAGIATLGARRRAK